MSKRTAQILLTSMLVGFHLLVAWAITNSDDNHMSYWENLGMLVLGDLAGLAFLGALLFMCYLVLKSTE